MAKKPKGIIRRWIGGLCLTIFLLGLCLIGLFVGNIMLSDWQIPEHGIIGDLRGRKKPKRLVVMAYNIAKCDAYEGTNFRPADEIKACIKEIAALIKKQNPDIVFLSEVNKECGPCPVDQVGLLAKSTGLRSWVFGENFRWGLPFYQIRSGNAILSRYPLRGVHVQELSGNSPFWYPKGTRRILWANLLLGTTRVLVASIRNESFDLERNRLQVNEILTYLSDRNALLAGDFNAPQDSGSMKDFRDSGKFSGSFDGPMTFPSDKPNRTIDYILAPAKWKLLNHKVIDSQLSDHRPVVSTFKIP